MNCCRNQCGYGAAIIAILAGVALGVLYALGFVSTGIIFWAYLGIGVLGMLLAPLYAAVGCRCFCGFRRLYLAAAIGTVITAVAGLIVAAVGGVVAIAVVLGIATFAVVLLLGTVVCVTECLCER